MTHKWKPSYLLIFLYYQFFNTSINYTLLLVFINFKQLVFEGGFHNLVMTFFKIRKSLSKRNFDDNKVPTIFLHCCSSTSPLSKTL
jgi:hypothetical protein